MPTEQRTFRVGQKIGTAGQTPITISADFKKKWGQALRIRADNRDFAATDTLFKQISGFYVVRITCRDAADANVPMIPILKIGRSTTDIRSRLSSYLVNPMNDVELLSLIIFQSCRFTPVSKA